MSHTSESDLRYWLKWLARYCAEQFKVGHAVQYILRRQVKLTRCWEWSREILDSSQCHIRKSIVRPRYFRLNMQAWRPHLIQKGYWQAGKGAEEGYKFEMVEGYSYRSIRGLEHYPGDKVLEGRWNYLIEVFKIFKGFENVDSERFFQVVGEDVRRGHSLKLFKRRLDVGRFKFASRVCEEWNRLDGDIVAVGSVNAFKK